MLCKNGNYTVFVKSRAAVTICKADKFDGILSSGFRYGSAVKPFVQILAALLKDKGSPLALSDINESYSILSAFILRG